MKGTKRYLETLMFWDKSLNNSNKLWCFEKFGSSPKQNEGDIKVENNQRRTELCCLEKCSSSPIPISSLLHWNSAALKNHLVTLLHIFVFVFLCFLCLYDFFSLLWNSVTLIKAAFCQSIFGICISSLSWRQIFLPRMKSIVM